MDCLFCFILNTVIWKSFSFMSLGFKAVWESHCHVRMGLINVLTFFESIRFTSLLVFRNYLMFSLLCSKYFKSWFNYLAYVCVCNSHIDLLLEDFQFHRHVSMRNIKKMFEGFELLQEVMKKLSSSVHGMKNSELVCHCWDFQSS